MRASRMKHGQSKLLIQSTTTDIDRLNSSILLQRFASDKPFVYSKDAGSFHRTCNFTKNSFYFEHESVEINSNVSDIRKVWIFATFRISFGVF